MPQKLSREEKQRFEELFRQLYRNVFQVFAHKGCGAEESQDLASETFLRAYRSFSGFRGEAKASTWLHTIAANVWRNRLRDAATGKRDGVEVPIPEEGQGGETFSVAPGHSVESDERRQLLKSAIEKLPPKMRRCVWLRVYQGMSFRDIAEVLDVTESTAKSQVSMAQPRLRTLLSEHYPGLAQDLGD